jgi:hypothetical protein
MSLIVGSPTGNRGQLTCRNGIRFLSLIGSNPVIMIIVIAGDAFRPLLFLWLMIALN